MGVATIIDLDKLLRSKSAGYDDLVYESKSAVRWIALQ